jgi:predicted amidohydrolase
VEISLRHELHRYDAVLIDMNASYVPERMKIALASPRIATSIEDGLDRVRHLLSSAAAQDAVIVCFPEAYVPGLRGLDFAVPPFEAADEARVLDAVGRWAGELEIAVIDL